MQIGISVSIPASLSVRTTSSAASVPSTPSNLPPVGWVSRCEPSPTGGFDMSRPLRRPNIEPSASTCTSRPAASQALRNQSRTCLSSGPSVSRRTPPFGVAPNFAVSWIVSQSRAESICRLDASLGHEAVPRSADDARSVVSMTRLQRRVNNGGCVLRDLGGEIGDAFDRDACRAMPASLPKMSAAGF